MQGSLWKLKKGITGTSWKKHWVLVDESRIAQWPQRTQPTSHELPKYTLNLEKCTIEESQLRKFCFKITERGTKITLILAADDYDSFEHWLRVLFRNKENLIQLNELKRQPQQTSLVNNEEGNEPDAQEKSTSTTLAQFFDVDCEDLKKSKLATFVESFSSTSSSVVTGFSASKLKAIFRHLDPSLNSDVVIRLVLRDLCIEKDDWIAYDDFVVWWKNHCIIGLLPNKFTAATTHETGNANDIINTNPDISYYDNNRQLQHYPSQGDVFLSELHSAGFINHIPDMGGSLLRSSLLLRLQLPNATVCKSILLYSAGSSNREDNDNDNNYNMNKEVAVEDWNETYQSKLELVAHAGLQLPSLPNDSYHINNNVLIRNNCNNSSLSAIMNEITKQVSINTNNTVMDSDIINDNNGSGDSSYNTNDNGQQTTSLPPPLDHGINQQHQQQQQQPSMSAAESQWVDAIKACASLNDIKGLFYKTAMDGVRAIIDEYSLPDDMKTASPLSPYNRLIRSDHTDDNNNNNSNSSSEEDISDTEEVYAYAGLLFSINASSLLPLSSSTSSSSSSTAASSSSTNEIINTIPAAASSPVISRSNKDLLRPTASDVNAVKIYTIDQLRHHIAGNEYRNTITMHNAIEELEHQNIVSDKVAQSRANAAVIAHKLQEQADARRRRKLEEGQDNNNNNDEDNDDDDACSVIAASVVVDASVDDNFPNNSSSYSNINNKSYYDMNNNQFTASMPLKRLPMKPSTLLSTVIDYAGFRVTVLCPTHIDEPTTLVHGPVTTTTNNNNNNNSSNKYHSSSSNSNSESTVYISALPSLREILPQIAAQMKLTMFLRTRRLVNARLCELQHQYQGGMAASPMAVDTITAGLQAHQSLLASLAPVGNNNNSSSNYNNSATTSSAGGRVYLLHLDALMPADLPRPHSFDVITRQLRPEYVRNCNTALCADILQESASNAQLRKHRNSEKAENKDEAGHENNDEEDNDDNNDDDCDSVEVDRLYESAIPNIAACSRLYHNTLPTVIDRLDSMAVIPIDSYGLTTLLHSHGVNCRHLGVLYCLSKSTAVKQLLLSECLARCCKSLLRAQWCAQSRSARSVTIQALRRNRSSEQDYREYVDEVIRVQRREAVLSLFNLVLGWGPATDAFWTGSLCGALKAKYGIDTNREYYLPNSNTSTTARNSYSTTSSSSKDSISMSAAAAAANSFTSQLIGPAAAVHWPQLFIAMQYHTGTRFKDNAVYTLCTVGITQPFVIQNITEHLLPQVKMHHVLPGEIGKLCSTVMGDELLVNGFPMEATAVYELQYLLLAYTLRCPLLPSTSSLCYNNQHNIHYCPQSTASTTTTAILCPQQSAMMAHLTYKIALSQYQSSQLHAASRTIRTYLSRNTRFHPIAARMLTLLMCITYCLGDTDKALIYFDAAQEVYTYTLGVNHPLIAIHIRCLGDLYQATNWLPQAKVMQLLAHTASKNSLGDCHIMTAMSQSALAATYLQEGDYKEAALLLEHSIAVFVTAAASSAASRTVAGRDSTTFLRGEAATSLYSLSVCYTHLGDYVSALRQGLRSVQLLTTSAVAVTNTNTTTTGSKQNAMNNNKLTTSYPTAISCYLLVADLYLQMSEVKQAVEMLQHAWLALLPLSGSTFADACAAAPATCSAIQRTWAGKVMPRLARRILTVLLANLPMSTRSLLDSVSNDWMRELQQQQALHQHQYHHQQNRNRQLHSHYNSEKFSADRIILDMIDELADAPATNEEEVVCEDNERDVTMITSDENAAEYEEGEGKDGDDVYKRRAKASAAASASAAQAAAIVQWQWTDACSAVSEGIWRYYPVEYFNLILQGIQQMEIYMDSGDTVNNAQYSTVRSSDKEHEMLPNTVLSELTAVASLPAQVAVILKLVRQHQQHPLGLDNNIDVSMATTNRASDADEVYSTFNL